MAEAPASPAPASPAPDPAPAGRFLAVVAILGAIAFGAACWIVNALARSGAYGPIADALFVTPFWQDAVRIVQSGEVPYRDFALEYPPLSLPVFVLPALSPLGGTSIDDYRRGFEIVVSLVGMAVVPLVVATIARLGGRRADVVIATGVVAASPLILGATAVSRYDLWPALLTAAAVAAMLWDRHRVGFALLALGALAKIYPAALAPVFLAWAWHRAGGVPALKAVLVGTAVGIAALLPFAAVAFDGALTPFTRPLGRPLQVESLGASVLIALHDVAALPLGRVTYEYESFNLPGSLADTLATLESGVLLAVLVAVWVAAARRPLDAGRFVLACAAVVCANVAFGKVLSPQYMLWLIPPLAILGPSRRGGSWPLAGLVGVLVLTSLYYPAWYARYIGAYDLAATVVVLERNVGLVLLTAYTASEAGAFAWLRRWWPGPPRPRRRDPRGDRAPAGA